MIMIVFDHLSGDNDGGIKSTIIALLLRVVTGHIANCNDVSGDDFDVYDDNDDDDNHLFRKSVMALLRGDIPLCSVPPKVTFLLVGVGPLAELITAVHLSNKNLVYFKLIWFQPMLGRMVF